MNKYYGDMCETDIVFYTINDKDFYDKIKIVLGYQEVYSYDEIKNKIIRNVIPIELEDIFRDIEEAYNEHKYLYLFSFQYKNF
jgi:hypothetical protein